MQSHSSRERKCLSQQASGRRSAETEFALAEAGPGLLGDNAEVEGDEVDQALVAARFAADYILQMAWIFGDIADDGPERVCPPKMSSRRCRCPPVVSPSSMLATPAWSLRTAPPR